MSIRKKILLVFFAIMATIAAALVLFSQTVLLDKFINVEQKQAESELEQLSASIDRERINLSSTVKDYAVWDLTYQFTQDRNISFIDTNITQENFNNLDLTYWIITDIQWGADIQQRKYIWPTKRNITIYYFWTKRKRFT